MKLLRDAAVRRGDRWIFSAGFNVGRDLRSTGRVDAEVEDLRLLSDAGARVAVLSHQGTHGSADDLDHVAHHLAGRLGREVAYVPDNIGAEAERRANAMAPGEITVFGNTRFHAGEQRDDPHLARAFARLGDAVAVGGFSKAHRSHASSTGVLRHLPGYLAGSIARELDLLAPWAGEADRRSVAVLGGVKKEKTLVGLATFRDTYDIVVPGGAVLVAVLRALGLPVGASERGEDPEGCITAARDVLTRPGRARLHVPERLVVAKNGRTESVAVDAVPDGWAVVDFELAPWLSDELTDLARTGGRAFIAGTPCLHAEGHQAASTALLTRLSATGVDALLLGGDTVAELPWDGPASTGGGSALHYLAHGTCPVLDALRAQHPPENAT
ncbi:phosphoglycerate kinase [Streptomyces sp. NPDC050287]|uniref:phosphoglycerate kinase n=1 Tax=Streptomyces sp. NPDC050287 TaxID=3365608 RepID=UPI0037BCFB31